MRPHLSLKNHLRENQTFLSRTVFASFLILSIVGILFVRLAYLQLFNHDHYVTLSEENRVEIVPIEPPRGLITDRNGVLIADNRLVFSLEIVPERIKDLDLTLQALRKVFPLTEGDMAEFKRQQKRSMRFERVPLKTHLTDEEIAIFSEQRYQFPGIHLEARLERYYPFGEATAHVLGYVGPPTPEEQKKYGLSVHRPNYRRGKEGLEQYHEDTLQGIAGQVQVETNVAGRMVRYLKNIAPIPGQPLKVTLDSRLQLAAAEIMKDKKGAVVALEPKTGEILAFSSFPSFDPNGFVRGLDPIDYASLQNDSRQPLFSRPLRGRYPPGSTIKPFIALAGLNYNVVHPGFSISDPGFYRLPNVSRQYRDWKKEGHGIVNLEKAIVESCDTYFYTLSNLLGIDRMSDFLSQFGFGELTHIDLLQERKGVLPSRAWKWKNRQEIWFPGETIITGIGQGAFSVTPLQLAVASAMLANKGHSVRPHLIPQVSSEIEAEEEAPEENITSAKNWEFVLKAMENVVHTERGTAWKIGKDVSYRVAGKTGTAQVFSIPQGGKYVASTVPIHLRDHSLFISYAPVEDPKIALAVVVENGGSGSAPPVARAVLDRYLLEEQPSTTPAPQLAVQNEN